MAKSGKNKEIKSTEKSMVAKTGVVNWFYAAMALVFAAGIMYLLRQQGGLTTTNASTQQPVMTRLDYNHFLATSCSPQYTWQPAGRTSFEDLWSNKMIIELQPSEQHNTKLADDLRKASHKLALILNEIKNDPLCAPDACAYIEQVLASNDFKIVIYNDVNANAYGFYRVTAHQIRIPLTQINHLNKQELIKTFLHEFWHAHKTLNHNDDSTPALGRKQTLGMPYNVNAHNKEDRKKALIFAIDQGDHRVIHELPMLREQHKKGTLSATQAADWQRYSEVIAAVYQPKRIEGIIDKVNFKKIFPDLKRAIDKKEAYVYQFQSSGETLTCYVDSYELRKDGSAILRSTGGPDKVNAFIHDTRLSKYNSHLTHKKMGYNVVGSLDDSAFVERDAEIAENGPAINAVFYPERQHFHDHCDMGRWYKL